MANTTVADLTSIIQVIVAETQFTTRHNTVMRPLVRVLDMPEHKGNPIDRPKMGRLTAGSLTEGEDIASPQTVTDTDISINPLEVGLQSVLTDRMISRAPGGFEMMVATEHARAFAEKFDTDLLGLFSGFSIGRDDVGNSLGVAEIGAGRANIKSASEPGPDPLFVVLHTNHAWDIVDGLIPLVGAATPGGLDNIVFPIDGVSNQALMNANIGKLFSMAVFESGLIAVDSNDDAYSAVFSKEALLLVVTDEGSMRPERDESLRATELNYVGEYGFGEWVNSYGYFLRKDAAAPSN